MFQTTLQKAAWIGMGVCLMAAAMIPSCAADKKVAPVSPTQDIRNLGTDIGKTGDDLKVTTTTIKDNATQGMAATPPALGPVLNPHWSNILTAAGVQQQLVSNLGTMETRATEAEKKSAAFEKSYNAEHDARVKAEDSTTKQLKEKYMTYSGILFFISLICGGLAIFSNGNKIALYGGILAAVGAATCIFIVQTVSLIPWIIGGLALTAIGLGVYTFLHNRALLEKQKAATAAEQSAKDAEAAKVVSLHQSVHEVVETLEAAKPKMTMDGRAAMFGDGPGKGEAFSIQSRETEDLVKKVRAKIEKAPAIPATMAVDWNCDGVIDEKDILVQPKTLSKKYVLK